MDKYTYALKINTGTYYGLQGFIELPAFSRERAIERYNLMK